MSDLNRFGVPADEFPQECAHCAEPAFFWDALRREHVCETHIPTYARPYGAPLSRHLRKRWEEDGRSTRGHLIEWEDRQDASRMSSAEWAAREQR